MPTYTALSATSIEANPSAMPTPPAGGWPWKASIVASSAPPATTPAISPYFRRVRHLAMTSSC